MKYILEYDEFLYEGLLANKIEKYKTWFYSTYKNAIVVRQIIANILTILSLVGLAVSGILVGILYIHKKYPNFVNVCADRANPLGRPIGVVTHLLPEAINEDSMVKNILDKFYTNKKLMHDIDTINVNRQGKINAIGAQLQSIFTEEEKNFLKKQTLS